MIENISRTPLRGAVAIGRNEGERLRQCLLSLRATSFDSIVYVDSGSSDSSVEVAGSLGIEVVSLDLNRPFTAGRARNEGFRRLCETNPRVDFVQFIDGDCRLAEGWLDAATAVLLEDPATAIVCGRRKEVSPEASVYNRLCDIEWNSPVGIADSCGGDFLVRRHAFEMVDGFEPRLIAGEEPELCYRLRKEGWIVRRIDRLMTFHDAAMKKWSQWARRACRSGYAYMARAQLHFRDGSKYCWRQNARIVLWAAVLPAAAVTLAVAASPWFLLLLALYPVQVLRLRRALRTEEASMSPTTYALFSVAGNWLEFSGQMLFLYRRLAGTEQTIIEYK